MLLAIVFAFVVARPIIIAVLVPEGAPPGRVDPRVLWEAAEAAQKAVIILLFFVSA